MPNYALVGNSFIMCGAVHIAVAVLLITTIVWVALMLSWELPEL
jgi:hypothetical protein